MELEVGCVAQQAGTGDPSPGNIRAISGRESVEVQACGKNLYDANAIAMVTNYPPNGFGVLADNLVIGATYTISANADVFSVKISNTRWGHDSVHRTNITDGKYTFIMARNGNIPNDTKQYLFVYPADNSSGDMVETAEQALAMQIQLELGSTATSYEPYTPMGGGVVTPSEPLYGLPDAMDTVEVDASGDVTVTRRTAVVELDGTESITYGNAGASTEVQQFNASQLAVGGVGDINSPVICSHLPYSPNVSGGATLGIGLFPSSPHALIVFGMPIAALTQYGYIIGEQDTWVPAFKSYLAAQKAAGTPVTIVYELAAPETEALTAISPIAPQPGQLNLFTDADALTATVRGSGWEIINDTDGLSADIQEAQDDISGMVGSIDTIENNISAMASQILTPDQIISTVVESTDFQTVSTQVIQTGEGLAIVQTTVDDLGDRVDVIEGAVVIEGANIDIGRSDSNTKLHLDNEG